MQLKQIMLESAFSELNKKLPSLSKSNYHTINQLMGRIARKHDISQKALAAMFKEKYKRSPHIWSNHKSGLSGLNEIDNNPTDNLDIKKEIEKFVSWSADQLKLETIPKITLSTDTQNAQDEHHTGSHMQGSNNVWVYVKNRNLVDILRTVFHELVHCRQGELGMLKPGCSYPGSPIEVMADAIAGKYIKIYGEKNHHIFQ